MNNEWNKVKDFQLRFGHPVSEFPKKMERDRAMKRYHWMLEEINEFLDADEIVEQADAMIDVIYFALGTLVEMGIKPDNLFDIVQAANMAKFMARRTTTLLMPKEKPLSPAHGKIPTQN